MNVNHKSKIVLKEIFTFLHFEITTYKKLYVRNLKQNLIISNI